MLNASTPMPDSRRNWLQVFFGSTFVLPLRPSGGENVYGCVYVAVMLCATLGALPVADTQGQLVQPVATVAAGFAGRHESPDLVEHPAVPVSLIGQLANKLKPRTVRNSLRQFAVFYHSLNIQVFDHDQLVFLNQSGRRLVGPVETAVGDSRIYLRNCHSCPSSPVGAFLLAGQITLGLSQSAGEPLGQLRIVNGTAIAEGCEGSNPQVNADFAGRWWHGAVVFVDADADEVFPTGRFADGDCRWIGHESTGPSDIQSPQLGYRQAAITGIPLECRASVRGGLPMSALLEPWIPCSLCKEVAERRVEMPQGLLEWNARNISQPRCFVVSFPRSQLGGCAFVARALASHTVGFGAIVQSPVEHIPHAAERSSKNLLLLCRWVESVSVGLDGHSNTLLRFDVLLDFADRGTPRSAHEITVRPQGWKATLERWVFLAKQAARPALDCLYKSMNPELRIAVNQQMNMVGHHFNLLQSAIAFLANFGGNAFESHIDTLNQHVSPVFRAPDDVVIAVENDISAGSDRHCVDYTRATKLVNRALRIGLKQTASGDSFQLTIPPHA